MRIYDPHQETLEIIAKLKYIGLEDWAQKLEDTIRAASTGTELAMTLRHALKVMLEKQTLPSSVSSKANTLVRELTRILNNKIKNDDAL